MVYINMSHCLCVGYATWVGAILQSATWLLIINILQAEKQSFSIRVIQQVI